MATLDPKIRAEIYLRARLGGRQGFDLDYFTERDADLRREVVAELAHEFEEVIQERIGKLRLKAKALNSPSAMHEDANVLQYRKAIAKYLFEIIEDWQEEIA